MTPPRGLLGSWRGGQRPPQMDPYESGEPKGPPGLSRSKKEGGHRPPKPSRIDKYKYVILELWLANARLILAPAGALFMNQFVILGP